MVVAVVLAAVALAILSLIARRHAVAPPVADVPARAPVAAAPTDESALVVPEASATRAGAAEATEPAPAAAAQDALEVVVATRDSLMPNARVVPDIRVVVGVGTPPFGAPGEGFARAGLALDAQRTDLREVTTDVAGRASVRIPSAEVEAARSQPDASVWVRVVEPGYQQRTLRKKLGPDASAPVEITLIAFAGRTVRGRVVDADGAPVAARVVASAPDFEGKVGMGAMGYAGADGWFEVMPFRGGVQHLLADAGEHGTAALRDVDVDALAGESVVLRVSGPGVVRGRVRDAGGNGVPGLELGICMAALDDDVGSFVMAEPAHTHAQLEGRGRCRATLVTDASGAFEVRGLRADRYVVRAGTSSHGPFPQKLTPAPVASDGAPLDLRLERTVLAVRIVDARGEPWKGKVENGSTSRSFGDPRVGAPDTWPDAVTLVVLPVAADVAGAERAQRTRPRFVGSRDAAGLFVVPCRAGARYRVGLMGGTEPWRPVEVEVPPLASRVDVTVRAAEDAARGALDVRVRDAAGETLTGGYSIRIEDVDDGATLVFDEVERWETGPATRPLPSGSYRVVVQGEPFIDRHHGTLMERTARGRFESVVEIRREQTTTLDALLPAGARIRAKITGVALDEDTAAVRASCPSCNLEYEPGFWTEQATTSLLADGRWPIPVEFPYVITSTSAAGTHLDEWLRLNRKGTSELLPAGRYRFEARLPGGRSASADVVLVDGQTTDVELAIDPR